MNKIFQKTRCLSLEDIELYLSEKASDDKRYEVENHLIDCPLCTDAIEGFANSHNFDQGLSDILPENFIADTENGPKSIVKSMKANRFSLRTLAATIAMLLIPAAAIYLYFDANEEQRLFKQGFETYSDASLSGLRSGNEASTNTLISNGVEAYSAKKYDESLLYFEKYLENENNGEIAFYAGLAALESNQLQKAIEYLTIARINSENYFLEASWYLGLTHLKRNEPGDAKVVFSELSEQSDGFYNLKAKALLEKLGN